MISLRDVLRIHVAWSPPALLASEGQIDLIKEYVGMKVSPDL